ncbi:hypothetical protein GCM10009662_04540 [Catellatospora coxensis]|uniref:Uncharacterized protein n=1 Tax=Catellatospora coxensis TaxID=310354 RepID=A0A8J3P5V6_9ACTN|nr:hypothetical protein Cco03nite_15170 [Catellatospora coxensis]
MSQFAPTARRCFAAIAALACVWLTIQVRFDEFLRLVDRGGKPGNALRQGLGGHAGVPSVVIRTCSAQRCAVQGCGVQMPWSP